MKKMYTGKTKDVYTLTNGHCLLQFKDDVTGEAGEFDPGSNEVGLTIEGAGKAGLRVTKYFFEQLVKKDIPTHFIEANLTNSTMTVKPAQMFGEGIEVICRYRAVGSFLRRYGKYVQEGDPLNGFVEFTLKDDERNDPPISEEGLHMLEIVTKDEYQIIKKLASEIAQMIKDELAKKSIELFDIKFEFGKVGADGEIALIDEISGGNMRAYKDGQLLEPLQLEKLLLN